jgi:hypothetical protein
MVLARMKTAKMVREIDHPIRGRKGGAGVGAVRGIGREGAGARAEARAEAGADLEALLDVTTNRHLLHPKYWVCSV